MIVINSDLMIQNQMELDFYSELLKQEIYNEESEKVVDCVIEYLRDVWDRDVKLTSKIQEQIDPDMYPLVFVDVFLTADFKAIRFGAASKKEGQEIKKKQKIAFQRYCNKYFKTMISLYDRFCNL